jgi:hypothetical protein
MRSLLGNNIGGGVTNPKLSKKIIKERIGKIDRKSQMGARQQDRLDD